MSDWIPSNWDESKGSHIWEPNGEFEKDAREDRWRCSACGGTATSLVPQPLQEIFDRKLDPTGNKIWFFCNEYVYWKVLIE